jgi:hypothetical protein
MISKVFVIKKVNINTGPILNVYGVMGVFRQMRSCEKRNAHQTMTLNQLG